MWSVEQPRRILRDIQAGWFNLTLAERRAVLLAVLLFALGLAARSLVARGQYPDSIAEPSAAGSTDQAEP